MPWNSTADWSFRVIFRFVGYLGALSSHWNWYKTSDNKIYEIYQWLLIEPAEETHTERARDRARSSFCEYFSIEWFCRVYFGTEDTTGIRRQKKWLDNTSTYEMNTHSDEKKQSRSHCTGDWKTHNQGSSVQNFTKINKKNVANNSGPENRTESYHKNCQRENEKNEPTKTRNKMKREITKRKRTQKEREIFKPTM